MRPKKWNFVRSSKNMAVIIDKTANIPNCTIFIKLHCQMSFTVAPSLRSKTTGPAFHGTILALPFSSPGTKIPPQADTSRRIISTGGYGAECMAYADRRANSICTEVGTICQRSIMPFIRCVCVGRGGGCCTEARLYIQLDHNGVVPKRGSIYN